ncbi:MAG: RHS repeat domain-containing protein [Janthinobacterium lividum]
MVVYDDWGRRTKLTDPDLGTISYAVDPLGQTWRQVGPREDAAKTATVTTYDALGRMTSRTAADATATWTYDVLPGQGGSCATTRSCGKLVRAATQAGSTALDYRQEFTYDALGRPDTTTRYLDVAYTSKLAYDDWGRLSRESFTRGNAAAKAYDRRYNAWGQLERIERYGAAIWTATRLDASGQVTDASLGNGLLLASMFDPHTGRLKNGTVKAAAQQRLHEAYQYDVLGNVSQRTQEWGATSFIENFEYDGLNRLTSSTIVGYAPQSFSYDDIGNLKSKVLLTIATGTCFGAKASTAAPPVCYASGFTRAGAVPAVIEGARTWCRCRSSC